MTIEEVLKIIPKQYYKPAPFKITTAENVQVLRLAAENGRVFAMSPRRRRYGHYVDPEKWLSLAPLTPPKDPKIEWERSWRRAARELRTSGLWPGLLEDINAALEIGYDNIKRAIEAERATMANREIDYDTRDKEAKKRIAEIDPRLNKSVFIYHLSGPAQIKSIYFGKYANEDKKAQVRELVKSGKAGTVYGRASYDVHFEFKPAADCSETGGGPGPKAWWSEEYKNCGNGHYYLALSAEHAVFWEDD